MKSYTINTTLEIIPGNRDGFLLEWRNRKTGRRHSEKASNEDLLSLKIVSEKKTVQEAARLGNVSAALIESVLSRSAEKGILLAAKSRIARKGAWFYGTPYSQEGRVVADVFTLQWHITQACDLHCRHCYDRSRRKTMTRKQGLSLLDDLRSFCDTKRVKGHVCFTGGNPLLHNNFFELYEACRDRGFSASILGNPAARDTLQKITAIQAPTYYQISIEGLRAYNDKIRGRGHFKRALGFLETLKEAGISSAVMLTLTDGNIDQVLPLCDMLRDKTDHFTFNRLSQVGRGASLALPSRRKYASFLEQYVAKAKDNPVIGYKDNLINTVLAAKGQNLFDGCTGYGCGAAFNFITVLPEGEAHACRKFPSPIGNVLTSGISAVYESPQARVYRKGPVSCRGCSLRPVCGGCMAIVHSEGRNVFKDKDPYCFKEQATL